MTDQERDDLVARVSRALEVPEPSPLFWEHFPARVRSAVRAAPAGSAPGPWRRARLAMLTAATAALAAFASFAAWTFVPDGADSAGGVPAVSAGEAAPHGFDALDGDAGWAIVTAAAASAGPDMLRDAGFGVAPGRADSAVEDLSETERAALMALLLAEMRGRDADGL